MNAQTFLVIDAVLALVGIGLLVYAIAVLRRVRRTRSSFADQSKPADLEEILGRFALKIKVLEGESQTLREQVKSLRHHTGTTVQKIGLVRFNSFADEGGNLSFCCALLDEHDNGVILTSMHGRQQNRIYAKHIKGGASETPLSDEERQAMKNADQAWQEKFDQEKINTAPSGKKPKSKAAKRS